MFFSVNVSGIEIEFALLDGKAKVVSRFSISTQNKKTSDQYTTEIKNVFEYLKINNDDITHSAILSSVPKFNTIICDFFKQYVKIEPMIIEHVDIPMNCANFVNKTDIPIDVLAGCFACNKTYGENIIFVNFDTLITFGVCVDNEFLGYTAYPGVDMLANAVHQDISDYPEIIITATRDSYSSTRYGALNCGVFNGAMGACDNIINSVLDDYPNKQFKVIATCKNPELLQYSHTINIIDQDMMIKSIVECAKYKMFSV